MEFKLERGTAFNRFFRFDQDVRGDVNNVQAPFTRKAMAWGTSASSIVGGRVKGS